MHTNPWLCPDWLNHYREDCDCRSIRAKELVTPNLGFLMECGAIQTMSENINEILKHKTFGYNNEFINFASEFMTGSTINPWIPKCIHDAIMDFGTELNKKIMSVDRETIQPKGFNLAPEYYLPQMRKAFIMLKKDPSEFLLHYVDYNKKLASIISATV